MSVFTNAKLAFLASTKSKPIKHEVQGTQMDFYPMSGKAASGLRHIVPKIGKLVEVYTADTSKDTAQSSHSFTSAKEEAATEETNNEAAPITTLKWRSEQRQNAIQDMVDCIFSLEMRESLFDLIASCLRIGPENRPTPEEFFEEITLEALSEVLVGCIKANKKVMGPFSDLLSAKMQKAVGSVVRQVEATEKKETDKTHGQNSEPNTSTAKEGDTT